MPKALITGVTGQDGSYLAELLLEKGYEVHGIVRRSSLEVKQRISHLYQEPQNSTNRFHAHYGDVTDSLNLFRLISEIKPDEIYNLAAQSHVRVSFETPEYTANADALGSIRILDALRTLGMIDHVKFYQASTSELYGKALEFPQTESTPFYPRSPYGVAKLYSYWITVNYREAYGAFATNGILFNHESERRGNSFVTKKIVRAVADITAKKRDKLYIGNMDARRDWGYAPDFVEAMWLIMQHDVPDDFVVATGESHSVREFIERSFAFVDVEIEWSGDGKEEVGRDRKTGTELVAVDPWYFRPTEVEHLIGDFSKAKKALGWEPKVRFDELIDIMMKDALDGVKKT